jgi:hypothetical protein
MVGVDRTWEMSRLSGNNLTVRECPCLMAGIYCRAQPNNNSVKALVDTGEYSLCYILENGDKPKTWEVKD